ncbi:MAG: peptidoglycan-binding domain-containing protein [Saprospiraceae bacterium]
MKFNLGSVDADAMPTNKDEFFNRFHTAFAPALKQKKMFRDEGNSAWTDFQPLQGSGIRDLQQFLLNAGFLARPEAVDGIYGYTTQAAVRLFQEYIRTVQGDASIGVPDGVAGPNTLGFVEKWKQANLGMSEWGASASNPSQEYKDWITLLEKAKSHFQTNPSPIRQRVEAYTKPTDTRKVNDWDVSPETIHLIGLRNGQELFTGRRENDDLFVLLIRGMVFKFWGSTDPNPNMADRKDIPFLIEGQHHYQFGWHKVSDEKTVYRALRPASVGVLVFRDKNADRILTEADIATGFEETPNTTINIHWSGVGSANFSAGCQVIAGHSYINHKDSLVPCSQFAAVSYSELGSQKTRAAYNVFTDLLLAYAPQGVRTIAYTLGRDETLRLSNAWKPEFVQETVKKMKQS